MDKNPKPCPFCGESPREYATGNVCCMTAGCAMFAVYTPRPMWDRRAPGPATAKMVTIAGEGSDYIRRILIDPGLLAAFVAEHEPAGPIQPGGA